jgi:uncharacterized RDD family membrane protein YckC
MAKEATMEPASLGKRFIALIIDSLIIWVVADVLARLLGVKPDGLQVISIEYELITVGFALVYAGYFLSTSGQTLGKKLLSIKVVTADGSNPTLVNAVLREAVMVATSILRSLGLASMIFSIIPLVDIFWVFTNAKKQALHDVVAKTYVVKA